MGHVKQMRCSRFLYCVIPCSSFSRVGIDLLLHLLSSLHSVYCLSGCTAVGKYHNSCLLLLLAKRIFVQGYRPIQVLEEGARGVLESPRRASAIGLKGTGRCLSHQISKLLVSKREFIWDQRSDEEKSGKNG